jgi:hypothetical protein
MRSRSLDVKSLGLATPVDEQTGLPLPILITDPQSMNANINFVDYHHHFHPERELVYHNDALTALRRSRGQELPRWLHEHYHNFFAGPELPKNRKDIFGRVILACAGVVPRQVIDFGNGKATPRVVSMDNDNYYRFVAKTVKHEADKLNQSRKVSRSHDFYRTQIGIFLANYAIEQPFQKTISSDVIDEFLMTGCQLRRKTLGNLMLREAIHIAVEPIVPLHRHLYRQGLAHRKPMELTDIVRDYFVRSRQQEYFMAMQKKLYAAR